MPTKNIALHVSSSTHDYVLLYSPNSILSNCTQICVPELLYDVAIKEPHENVDCANLTTCIPYPPAVHLPQGQRRRGDRPCRCPWCRRPPWTAGWRSGRRSRRCWPSWASWGWGSEEDGDLKWGWRVLIQMKPAQANVKTGSAISRPMGRRLSNIQTWGATIYT